MEEDKVQKIVQATAKQFSSFGGGELKDGENPIAAALKDGPARFAMGVSVEEVVRFVISAIEP